jgi:hypothetical protein
MDPTLVDASPPPLAMSSAIMIVEEAAADEEERGEERPVTARTPKPAAPPPIKKQANLHALDTTASRKASFTSSAAEAEVAVALGRRQSTGREPSRQLDFTVAVRSLLVRCSSVWPATLRYHEAYTCINTRSYGAKEKHENVQASNYLFGRNMSGVHQACAHSHTPARANQRHQARQSGLFFEQDFIRQRNAEPPLQNVEHLL